MKKKVTFQNMDHSLQLEEHAYEKLKKVEELLKKEDERPPHFLEVWFKAHKQHPHHGVEIHLKTPQFDLHAHEEGADMYIVLDSTIDKIIKLIKKSKERMVDKRHKVESDKREFEQNDDKYTLADIDTDSE